MKSGIRHQWLLMLLGLASSSAMALDTKLSGFAQVTAGRVISGGPTTGQSATAPYGLFSGSGGSTEYQDYACPCFVGNYEHAGVYEYHKTQWAPESLAGVQADFQINHKLSATVQAVARGADHAVSIDWAFASYNINQDLSVQVGRKRLPLYYYSDFMYFGYAYPWIRPNQDLYAWQIYSYDGANVLYKFNRDGWAMKANVWVGNREDDKNAELSRLYYGRRISETWKRMLGGYVTATNDTYDLRAVYMHTTVYRWDANGLVMSGENGERVNGVGQDFYGLSFNVDHENWLLRSELNFINRPAVKNKYVAKSISVGRQFGEHTVMLGWGKFHEMAAYWPDATEVHATTTLSYRWDFTKDQAVKLQLDSVKDDSRFLFTGNARLLSASWNIVF